MTVPYCNGANAVGAGGGAGQLSSRAGPSVLLNCAPLLFLSYPDNCQSFEL